MKTLAEIAIDAGLVTRADAAHAGRLAEHRGVALIDALIRELSVDELALVAAIHRQTRVPLADPATVRPDGAALHELPREVCERLRVLPLMLITDGSGVRVLRLAMADPTDAHAVAEIEQLSGCEVEVMALPLSAVEELIEQGYSDDPEARPRRRLFGDDLIVATRPHHGGPMHVLGDDDLVEIGDSLPPPFRHDESPEAPVTVPFHNLADEADVATRVRALVTLLVAKGVISEDEYEASVRDLLRRRADES